MAASHRPGFDPDAHRADSAGQPFAGRHFTPTAYPNDDGSASPDFLSAYDAMLRGEVGEQAVLEALRTARLLAPLVAQLGDTAVSDDGHTVDKTQELAIVTVEGPDGRRVLPAFSSVAAMTAWRSEARPIPADAIRVALAAASEGTELVVIDPGSPTEIVLRRPAIRALAESSPWVPCYDDPEVLQALAEAAATEPAITALATVAGDPTHRLRGPELTIRLALVPGLDQQQLGEVIARLTSRWAENSMIADRVDSMGIQLVASA